MAMISRRFLCWMVASMGLGLCFGTLADEGQAILCQKSQSFLAPADSANDRQYAPDREVDILNLALDVTPDFQRRTIAGKEVLTFKPIAKPLTELKLDAVDLDVQSVTSSAKIDGYQI